MARSYDQIFAATAPKSIVANTPASRENFTPAEFWLNVGYQIQVPNEKTGEMEMRFVSVSQGIPLDTMKRVVGNSQFANARNELGDRLLAVGHTVDPGGNLILKPGMLVMQIHRTGGEVAPVTAEMNPFVREFDLV